LQICMVEPWCVRCHGQTCMYLTLHYIFWSTLLAVTIKRSMQNNTQNELTGRAKSNKVVNITTPDTIYWGLVRFREIQSGRNNKCMKKIMIWTWIYSGSKINLPIMIGRTRDRRAGLIPHLLTSGLIPSLLVYLSWAN
jgi:hypothetical protein